MAPAYERIYAATRQIPTGRVATYGTVAHLAGLPGQARLVGYALFRVALPDTEIPWHRVINAKGEISRAPSRHGSDWVQQARLLTEGIVFTADGKIPLAVYGWPRSLYLK
ncbi:MAG: methyltransferase [Oscillatoriales cyanobacterium SM2_1_8]|nr:methyltransferase [Oscillatoriales cyanobacterium SM2_1_8]